MAFNYNYLAPILIAAVITFSDVFCADLSIANQKRAAPVNDNPWRKDVINLSPTDADPKRTSTTPWPELGQKHRPRQTPPPPPKQPIISSRDFVVLERENQNNRQKFTGDFLAGERGDIPNKPAGNRRDYVAPPKNSKPAQNVAPLNPNPTQASDSNKRDYAAAVKPNANVNNKPTPNNQAPTRVPEFVDTNKRDYVAPVRPNQNVQPKPNIISDQKPSIPSKPQVPPKSRLPQSPTRDYVNPNQPKPNIISDQKPTIPPKPQVPPKPQPPQNPTRDYVNPNQPKPNAWNTPLKLQPSSPSTAQNANQLKPTTPNVVSSTGPTTVNQDGQTSQSSKGKMSEDDELREFSEALLKKDVNNAAKYVTINYQGKTTSGSKNDQAPEPLLKIRDEVYQLPSVSKLVALHNNYILESNQNEVYTGQEKIEENNFLDTILPSAVMQHTRNFLIQKGKLTKDPKDFRDMLKTMWFNMYSRGQGKIGSSGFEHVFLAEIKNDAISGLHNWVYFNDIERKNQANYLGYLKILDFEKGAILKYHFNMNNIDKPVGSMFIGTSPEFEMALYSTCFILRPNDVCPLRLGGKNFIIRTYNYRYRGKNMIGSAFPEI